MNYLKEKIILGVLLALAGVFVFQSMSPTEVLSPKGLVTIEEQIGDILVTPALSPKLSPKSDPRPGVSPSLSPVVTNDTKNTVEQAPASLSATPSKSPNPTTTPKVTPTPSRTPAPTQTITPTPFPLATPSPTPAPTQVPGDTILVLINEIAWMGTDVSPSDEWLELYNPTGQAVDLTGWTLKSLTGPGFDPNVTLSGTIAAQGFYLLERTDDDTLPQLAADQIYTGGLNNSPGEILELRDSAGNLMDLVGSGEAWYSGTNSPKASMERIDYSSAGSEPSNWGTCTSGSTPRATNSVQ